MAAQKQQWPLSKLRAHARQATLFGDLAEAELKVLMEDMEANGLRHPVEILPDGTIVAGHQRVRAAESLGWKTIDVVIRKDLDDQGDKAVEAYFINDNLLRRQLSPLGRARCVQRLMELAENVKPGGLGDGKREELKAKIADQLGISSRTVSRYLLILQAPKQVQEAFDRNDLSLVAAGRVALLSPREQRQVAQHLRKGKLASAAIREVIKRPPKSGSVLQSFRLLVNCLERMVPAVAAGAEVLPLSLLAEKEKVVRSSKTLLWKLLKRIETQKQPDMVSDEVGSLP